MDNIAIIYLTIINIIGLIVILVDRIFIKRERFKLDDHLIYLLASLGAAPGMYLVINFTKHKKKDIKFIKNFYIIFIIWLILTVLLLL